MIYDNCLLTAHPQPGPTVRVTLCPLGCPYMHRVFEVELQLPEYVVEGENELQQALRACAEDARTRWYLHFVLAQRLYEKTDKRDNKITRELDAIFSQS